MHWKNNFMIAFLLSVIFSISAIAADCANSERYYGNMKPLPELWTADRYNKEINDLYSTVASFDGTCFIDESVVQGSLDKTTASGATTLYKSLRFGLVPYASGSTIYVGPGRMFVGGHDVDFLGTWGLPKATTGSHAASNTEYYVMIPYTDSGTSINPYLTTTVPSVVAGDYTNIDATGNRCIGVARNNASSDFFQYVDRECHHADFRDNHIHTHGSGYRISSCVFVIADAEASHTTYMTKTDIAGECIAGIHNQVGTGIYRVIFKNNYWITPPACEVYVHNQTDANRSLGYSFTAPSVDTFQFDTGGIAGALVDMGSVVRCIGKVNF